MTRPITPRRLLWALAAAFMALAGCSEAPREEVPSVKSVKTAVAALSSGIFSRALSGVVEAQDSASLSFPVGGTLLEVHAERGDRVAAGQILARLDPKPFENRLRAAEARVRSAQAGLLKAKEQFQRKQSLLNQGFIAKAEFDEARASLAAAQGELDVADSEMEDARRDRSRTALAAPYAGVVARKDVNPFQEVKAGEPLFELMGAQGLKVRIMVPESLIGGVRPGDGAQVAFAVLKGFTVRGRVAEVGATAEAGNAFPVSVVLDAPPPAVRVGMTALVSLRSGAGAPVFLVPLTALAMDEMPRLAAGGGTQGKAPIFIFDPTEQMARLRLVEVLDLQDNFLAVRSGLAEGEEVIVAGAAFLRDGMPVRRWTPDTPKEELGLRLWGGANPAGGEAR